MDKLDLVKSNTLELVKSKILDFESVLLDEIIKNKEMFGDGVIGKMKREFVEGELSAIRVIKTMLLSLELGDHE